MWTIAKHTNSVKGHGGSWNEPEIGHGIYGELRDLPPLFTPREYAEEYAYRVYGYRKTKKTGINWTIVEMKVYR